MSLPLYQNHQGPSTLPSGAHTGLWFDKFCNQWTSNWQIDAPAKQKWIQTITKTTVGDKALLAEHTLRFTALAQASGGSVGYFKTTGRFAIGLGREHPIENGFVWHPTLGIPYLPGSSVKGLVRAWATAWTEADDAELTRIFGPRNSREAKIGTIIFFDALPTQPLQLAADVMTPHYGPYYQDDKGKTAPGDWHSPVPIPFLTVAADQSFLFPLAPRTAADQADCTRATKWLEEALRELGAGAKTAVGYGRFERDPTGETEAQKAAERTAVQQRATKKEAAFTASLADLSPLAREFAQAAHDNDWEADGPAFKAAGVVEGWLAKLEADPQPDAIQQLRRILNRHFSGLLDNPDKMGGKKNDRPIFKDRWRNIAKKLNTLPKP